MTSSKTKPALFVSIITLLVLHLIWLSALPDTRMRLPSQYVLAQDDVGGLEVKRKTDGEWIRVKPIPDSFVINIGDIIQVWSNDRYESVEHRVVVNSERERFSIPFFFNPSHYVMIRPLEELVDDEKHSAKYKEYNWGKFFVTKKLSNFRKLDVENIQVTHFKVSE